MEVSAQWWASGGTRDDTTVCRTDNSGEDRPCSPYEQGRPHDRSARNVVHRYGNRSNRPERKRCVGESQADTNCCKARKVPLNSRQRDRVN